MSLNWKFDGAGDNSLAEENDQALKHICVCLGRQEHTIMLVHDFELVGQLRSWHVTTGESSGFSNNVEVGVNVGDCSLLRCGTVVGRSGNLLELSKGSSDGFKASWGLSTTELSSWSGKASLESLNTADGANDGSENVETDHDDD